MSASPTISVVMPTYNRMERLRKALEALGRQTVDEQFEIVVVSDGSTDGTDEMLKALELDVPLQVLTQPNGGPASARNNGVSEAAGDLVVFIDDDLIVTEGLLQAHVDSHRASGDNAVVIGPMIDPPDLEMRPWVRWEQAMLRKQYRAMDAGEYEATARQFYTGNASLRRSHVLEAGGFDASFRRAEDVELAYRLDDRGLTFIYNRDAVGLHYADRSFTAWRSMAYDYGRNDVIFARDHQRDWIFPFMARKFGEHRPALRSAIAAAVRWPFLRPAANLAFRAIGYLASRAGFDRLASPAYSAIYGIEYHTGLADELGGPKQFFKLMQDGEIVSV